MKDEEIGFEKQKAENKANSAEFMSEVISL